MKPPGRGPEIEADPPGRVDPEVREPERELDAAARHPRMLRLSDRDLGGVVDRRPGLDPLLARDGDPAREDERLGARARFREAALDEEDVEPSSSSDGHHDLQHVAAAAREAERLGGVRERDAVRDERRGPHDAAPDERERLAQVAGAGGVGEEKRKVSQVGGMRGDRPRRRRARRANRRRRGRAGPAAASADTTADSAVGSTKTTSAPAVEPLFTFSENSSPAPSRRSNPSRTAWRAPRRVRIASDEASRRPPPARRGRA